MNAEQQLAATTVGHVVVRAGAGSGKTYVLVERYVEQLKRGRSPLEIVVITFTESAAAELRARIRARVAAEFHHDAALLAEFEAAPISTIHALAGRICREHPEFSQVAPGFQLLEELAAPLHKEQWLAEALDDVPDAAVQRFGYARLRRLLRHLHDDPFTAAQALERSAEDWSDLVDERRHAAWADLLASEAWLGAAAHVRAHTGPAGDLIETARRIAEQALDAVDAGHTVQALTLLSGVTLRGGKKAGWTDLEATKAALKRLRELAAADPLLALELNSADFELRASIPHLQDAVTRSTAALRRMKRRAGILEYADLEIHALMALNHPEVVEHYCRRWHAIMVDEFQDTSPVQAELLARLTTSAELTVVGDNQQAIYGFRGAGHDVFAQVQARIEERGGRVLTLETSYRAHRPLLEQINALAIAVLGSSARPLKAVRDGPASPIFAVLGDQETEAEHIAAQLTALLQDPPDVTDPQTGKRRPLRPKDVVVLARRWKDLIPHGEALSRRGVPWVMGGGGNLLQTMEMLDTWTLLRFLADPSDDVALLSVLRSPHFSVDDPTIERTRRAKGADDSWWVACQRSHDATVIQAVAILQALLSDSLTLPPRRLLQLADHLTGYRTAIELLPDGRRHRADHQASHELVEALQWPLLDCVSTAATLGALIASGQAVPRPPLADENAVTLSTIHGAKGLEWPVVALVAISGQARDRFQEVRLEPGLGVAIRERDEDGSPREPALYTLLKREQHQREAAEERRLLYVGMTRAREYLLLGSSNPHAAILGQFEQAGVKFQSAENAASAEGACAAYR